MIRAVLRGLGYLAWALVLVIAVLLAPVVWIETACRGEPVTDDYTPLIAEADRRDESRTLLTYPEWHIVHAYDDYARVIAEGDPHEFGFFRAITGFWSSLCALTERAAEHGGVTVESKQTIYTIGVSFTLEIALKAAYEESLGRLATLLRGPERSTLDDLSAEQAARYAAYLQQVPWYRWDFSADAAALDEAAGEDLRDTERRIALGLEFAAKGAYARAIAAAVASVGADELTIRSVVAGLSPDTLAAVDGVSVIAQRPQGVEIETPRYRAFTQILDDLSRRGGDVVEIAGNDDILLTALSDEPVEAGALYRFARQGYGDHRHLILVKVGDLAKMLRGFAEGPLRLEHVHDY